MSDFWNLSDGTKVDTEADTFEISTGEPVPPGDYVAMIKDLKLSAWEDNPERLQIQWQCVKPEKYKKRAVFQNIKINDPDPKKRDAAIRMLAAINKNSGGKLDTTVTPDEIAFKKAFTKRIMTIRVEVWELEGKTGNWVSKVSPKVDSVPDPEPMPAKTQTTESAFDDSDVPF